LPGYCTVPSAFLPDGSPPISVPLGYSITDVCGEAGGAYQCIDDAGDLIFFLSKL